MTTTREQLCHCGTPTTNRSCDRCLDQLHYVLDTRIPDIAEDLAVARSRQRGASIAGAGGHGSGETLLPWDDQASKAEERLLGKLRHWVRRCEKHDVATTSPYAGPPAETVIGHAAWLDWRVDGLAHHGFATAMLRDLTAATTSAGRGIRDHVPSVFLGRCEGTEPNEHEPSHPCPGEVYAREGEELGRCRECGRAYLTDAKRSALERELDDKVYSAAELARLTTHLGLDLDRDQVRKRINRWHAQRRIVPAQHDARTGDPLYRYGEIRDLLYEDRDKRHRAHR